VIGTLAIYCNHILLQWKGDCLGAPVLPCLLYKMQQLPSISFVSCYKCARQLKSVYFDEMPTEYCRRLLKFVICNSLMSLLSLTVFDAVNVLTEMWGRFLWFYAFAHADINSMTVCSLCQCWCCDFLDVLLSVACTFICRWSFIRDVSGFIFLFYYVRLLTIVIVCRM